MASPAEMTLPTRTASKFCAEIRAQQTPIFVLDLISWVTTGISRDTCPLTRSWMRSSSWIVVVMRSWSAIGHIEDPTGLQNTVVVVDIDDRIKYPKVPRFSKKKQTLNKQKLSLEYPTTSICTAVALHQSSH